MFEGADADNSGSLSFAEVTELLCTEGLDTSKSFVQGMMEVFADELENTSKIRVNCINPGPVRTKMREEAYPAEDPETNPLPEDIMNLYVYLMCDVSKDINGQSINAQ